MVLPWLYLFCKSFNLVVTVLEIVLTRLAVLEMDLTQFLIVLKMVLH